MRIAAAAVALALAVLAAVFAHDLDARVDALRAGDARFVFSGRPVDWGADTVFPAGASGSALGVSDDEQVREALRLFRAAYGRRAQIGPGEDLQAARAAAEAALLPLAARRDPKVGAQAGDLLGLLAADDPSPSAPGTPSPLERALTSFQTAVRRDPGNEAAKANLELALRLLEARGVRPGGTGGTGPRSSRGRGAGAGREGQGY